MGTHWKLHWQDGNRRSHETVHAALQRAFDLVIAQMSHYDPGSVLSRINRCPPGKPQTLPEEFLFVLQQALHLSELTQGAYNPNLGALSSACGFGPQSGQPFPERASYESPWQHIHLCPTQRTLTHELERLHLDLSSIGKGYALDLAGQYLGEIGIDDFLLEIGGEFLARGCKPNAHPWWVELSCHPLISPLRFGLTRHALATSGILHPMDSSHHHLLDPATGRPTQHALHTVTVLAPTCLQADAWATALFILGPEKGPTYAKAHEVAATFTDRHSHCHSPRMLAWLDSD
ncbi:FAD:protein FMN transferase [Roseimicrobium gellanilyticum]|nr:FAD:protein FMN transferase [Roseimicrobium gellanilyticum]